MIVSFLFLAAGLIFIYQPAWIIKANKFARERIFNDSLILLERRKKGFFFMVMFVILFYLGFQFIPKEPAVLSSKIVSPERILYQSIQHLHLKEYEESKTLCENLVKREPGNSEAFYQLAASQYLLNDKAGASASWKKAMAINPNSEKADRLIKLIVKEKNLPSENIPEFK